MTDENVKELEINEEVSNERLPENDGENAEDRQEQSGLGQQQSDVENVQQSEGRPEEKEQEPVQKEPRAQKRIKQLLDQKNELQKELERYKGVARPDAEKYDDDDEYEIDKTTYINKRAKEKEALERLRELEDERKNEEARAYRDSSATFNQKLSQTDKNREEFIRSNAHYHKPRDPDIEMEVMDSPYAAEIFEVVLKDVDRFNNMTNSRFLKEVAKLEAKFELGSKPLKAPISVPNPPTKLDQSNTGAQAAKRSGPDWTRMTYSQMMNMR